ncbi:hypothetical protein [Ornithinibacillus xuwenensis]|uniref:Uncharacterized protein n=1 Tax=Ornithinibacillus xuwenensis TaxID=3144668 RepID=A0ABU9XBV9_9BACI
MEKEILIDDLKRILKSSPDKTGHDGTRFFIFSYDEIEGIIEVLENQ